MLYGAVVVVANYCSLSLVFGWRWSRERNDCSIHSLDEVKASYDMAYMKLNIVSWQLFCTQKFCWIKVWIHGVVGVPGCWTCSSEVLLFPQRFHLLILWLVLLFHGVLGFCSMPMHAIAELRLSTMLALSDAQNLLSFGAAPCAVAHDTNFKWCPKKVERGKLRRGCPYSLNENPTWRALLM